MSGGAPNKSDNTNYYEILGVSKNASLYYLREAYSKAEIMNHPDKAGDPEKFKELTQAYDILSDPVKRFLYDRYGADGLRQFKGRDAIHRLMVSLEDLYNGTSKKLPLSRFAFCSNCKGIGSKSGASMKCSGCQGSGASMNVSSRHLGRSIIPQIHNPCNECKGTGDTIINDEDRCEQCKGEKFLQEKNELEVHVEKGMQNGQKISFSREAINRVTGGIVFILKQTEHPKFKRKDDDLFVEHTLSLKEALFGFEFGLTHLDNRQLIIKSEPGEVVKPGEFKEINDEGMPIYQRPLMKGKLYIHFKVDFPDSLTPDECKAVEAVRYPRPSPPQLPDMEEEDTATSPPNRPKRRRRHAGRGSEGAMSAAIRVDGNGGSLAYVLERKGVTCDNEDEQHSGPGNGITEYVDKQIVPKIQELGLSDRSLKL